MGHQEPARIPRGTLRGGKIVNVRDFPSHAEGLEAAGLSE